MLVVLSALALALTSTTNLGVLKAGNWRADLDARLAAESGMTFMTRQVSGVPLPSWAPGDQLLGVLATELQELLEGTPNLQGGSITYDGSAIVVPAIALDGGRSFTARIELASGNVLRLSITGSAPAGSQAASPEVARTVSMEFQPETPSAFSYGVFSKGPLRIGQNLRFEGINSNSEASMYSAAAGTAVVIESGQVDGDICTMRPDAVIDVGANVMGEIRRGVPPVTVVRPTGAAFKSFATTPFNPAANTFNNVVIEAGTNPTFNNNVTIRGVMYIKSPNIVTFRNNANLTGVIVTDDAGPNADPTLNRIYFKNNLTVHGPEELPDTPQFSGLRTMVGTAIMAPGFNLEFKNNFTSVSGSIVAESFTLKNNLDAVVYGSIIVLGDDGLQFEQNSTLRIDRSKYHGEPPGSVPSGPTLLVPMPDSYCEASQSY